MNDLTILYITASEVPENWMEFQLYHLKKSIGDSPIVSISRKPLDLGTNLIDSEPKRYWNIYMQMLRGALAADTPYVAMVEDDTLYTKEHFTAFRPPLDAVSYNRARWSLFTWDNIYCMRQRISNCSLIAPREYLITALKERSEKYPNGNEYVGEVGRSKVEHRLGVTVRNCVEWYCHNPIVQLNHEGGTDKGDYGIVNGKHLIKKHGQMKAYDIPYWGKATDILKYYN
jgi:hypothetical protein